MSLPINLLEELISESGLPIAGPSLMEVSIGVVAALQQRRLESDKSSKAYLRWLSTMPLEDRAISKPKMNFIDVRNVISC